MVTVDLRVIWCMICVCGVNTSIKRRHFVLVWVLLSWLYVLFVRHIRKTRRSLSHWQMTSMFIIWRLTLWSCFVLYCAVNRNSEMKEDACIMKCSIVVWSSHKWIGTSSGRAVIWTWSNQTELGTLFMPALDCCLLTFWRWECCVRALTIQRCKVFTRC